MFTPRRTARSTLPRSHSEDMESQAPEDLPIVRCPSCGEPMKAKGIEPATEALDDIVFVCPRCGTETKRTVKRG
jgi:hypothetical protein